MPSCRMGASTSRASVMPFRMPPVTDFAFGVSASTIAMTAGKPRNISPVWFRSLLTRNRYRIPAAVSAMISAIRYHCEGRSVPPGVSGAVPGVRERGRFQDPYGISTEVNF